MVLCRSNCDASCVPFRICENIHAFYFDENGDTKEMVRFMRFFFIRLNIEFGNMPNEERLCKIILKAFF